MKAILSCDLFIYGNDNAGNGTRELYQKQLILINGGQKW